jgi:hypothetical protein
MSLGISEVLKMAQQATYAGYRSREALSPLVLIYVILRAESRFLEGYTVQIDLIIDL